MKLISHLKDTFYARVNHGVGKAENFHQGSNMIQIKSLVHGLSNPVNREIMRAPQYTGNVTVPKIRTTFVFFTSNSDETRKKYDIGKSTAYFIKVKKHWKTAKNPYKKVYILR